MGKYKFSPLIALFLISAPAAGVFAQESGAAHAARSISEIFENMTGLRFLEDCWEPLIPKRAVRPLEDSLIPPGLWATLPAPDPALSALLVSRVPGVEPASVREMVFEAADSFLLKAAVLGLSPLDAFTDSGLRGTQRYVMTPATLEKLFAKYEIKILTLPSGTDKDGRPYRMQALLAGGGSVDILYDRDNFDYENPYFTQYSYIAKNLVREGISGPGDVAVSGLKVNAGIAKPSIKRFLKISATEMRVETSRGSRTHALNPIRLKALSGEAVASRSNP